jgi:ABC-type antimicrobial peptide transport system permease subunit
MKAKPPQWPNKLLNRLVAPHLREEILGDLYERYALRVKRAGESKARQCYWLDILTYIRFSNIKRKPTEYPKTYLFSQNMIRNYFKIASRNLVKNKAYSFINIIGLALGMAVAMLIGLWVYDELSFDKYHQNYDRIVQVMEHANVGDGISTASSLPMPLSAELRTKFGNDFEKVASTLTYEQVVSFEQNAFTKPGCYAEPEFTDIISLQMLKGTKVGLNHNSILISESLAKAVFGDVDPVNKIVKLNNSFTQQVAGVYKDMPKNTRFYDLQFIAPIDLLFSNGSSTDNWYSNSFQIYALLPPNGTIEKISSKIKNALYEHNNDATKPALFLYPMEKWHLYEFKNGTVVGGKLEFVWLFGIIGLFVLLLACINFMNLSTARSEKRAKEVGIRKAIGSKRWQLIGQFFSESLLVSGISFILSLLLVQLILPFFNDVADKEMSILWANPLFLLLAIGFSLFTGLLAGSYPALYLSSFQPIKVLKGVSFRIGRFASLPRKSLVVVQFTVSTTLIIGTIVVFQQIQHAKNRPIGYNRNGIMSIPFNSSEIPNYTAFRNEIISTKAVVDMTAASNPTTGIWSSADNLDWKGKDPNRQEVFGTVLIDPNFGNVVEWKIKEGRTFSSQFSTDSLSFVFNEAAIKQMGLKNPIGEIVKWHGKNWKIIGVVKDMVMKSPFEPTVPTVFLMNDKERSFNVINFKLAAKTPVAEAVQKIGTVFKKFAPNSAFNYRFADEEYAKKFAEEERIGKLATFFTILAIFISCLGLFGLAAFVAEQRTKEIGIRKVLGATVANLWQLLSKDFVLLVIISLFIASPIAYYFMNNWVHKYTYHTEISWWIFAVSGLSALAITLLTVSFQAIKAALMNPIKSLKSE